MTISSFLDDAPPQYLLEKSSGAMCIGVPTMLPLIMASGLQKPRSVILPRFCLSNCGRTQRKRLCTKLKKFQKSKIKLDRAHLNHPPPIQTFFKPITNMDRTTQIIITNNFEQCTYKQNTHGIVHQTISTGLELFWDDFPHKKIQSETWTHPPTSIVNSDFWHFFTLQSP